ncbi:sugar phosphate nucleotidyltransferase [Candidatus Pelagibacter sp. HIMB1623]|uniref:sugar phosphate nucleotidyltransferase n=1 Tax=Candidatus Pelagibacter sp. HIMB1623 TaxID=3413358 RepID=UPI003F87D428
MVAHHKKIDLVIPCAGMGKRLGILTKFITKNMVKIHGKSILEHQLDKFYVHKKKISKIHFILGYKSSILKSYILNLKLPFKIKFHFNKKYKTTGCAYSFSLALKHLKNDVLVLNSDLILNQRKISNIMNIEKNNFVYLRKPLINKKIRPIKAKIYKKKIITIDINKNNFDLDVVGPFKLSLRMINKLKMIHKSFSNKEFSKLSCYTFFGKITNYINLNYQILNDKDWYEINTKKEYRESFKEKIFLSNTNFKKS